MQDYGGSVSNKSREYRDCEGRECSQESSYSITQGTFFRKSYGCSNKELIDQTSYCRVVTGPENSTNQQHSRYTNSSAPSFSSPPNSPLVGLVFDPSSPNYSGAGIMTDHLNPDRRSQSSWSVSHQEPIGSGVKKKIVKSHDKRNAYSADPRYQEKYKEMSTETDHSRKKDRNLTSESTSSLDFFAEGERMVSELCNIPDTSSRNESHKSQKVLNQDQDDRNRHVGSSEILLTALDKIVIHDQIPNQIVQLAIEACTDAENIAIAHHNRPCFKNIHSICAKTRSNVQKPDSAVANLHSQGIPWVIKNFIFSFVRILDGWKGVKELLSEKHDTFSRIENKYYSQNIRECFVQWQAVTKEMLTHIYKTFKCLDHGFTMEQKSFTHNYYATNSAAPRHQNQSKFQSIKQHITPRPINASPSYSVIQPPWLQPQTPTTPQNYNESSWSIRSSVPYKKYPVIPPQSSQNFYTLSDQSENETYQKTQYKCDPCCIRESKPRQSWTITNLPDCRVLEGMCHADQRELYSQLKHKMDAELGKSSGQPILSNASCEILQRREIDLKAKMVPLSHVEKNLIPSMASSAEIRNCYAQKNNSCGDTKEEADFFAAWGQMVQKEPSDFLTHHTHNVQIPSNVVTVSNNISGPVQFIDPENDEFHEISKVYMKPGSYKVPIKPVETVPPFLQNTSQDTYENPVEDTSSLKAKVSFQQVTLAPQPKYNLESWPCLMSRRADDIVMEEQKFKSSTSQLSCLDMRAVEALDILSSMMSDKAWEAAKQSAPKLMDFIHEGSRSDTARLYNALGLRTNEELSQDLKDMKMNTSPNDPWTNSSQTSKHISSEWSQTSQTQDISQNKSHANDNSLNMEDNSNTSCIEQGKTTDYNEQDDTANKSEESKENTRRRNFDQTGNYVRDENQKKSSGKSKVAVSGTWYHPKKKKPLPGTVIKKFENILTSLSQINEATFIQRDMDIKIAPRFYEIVKYPMSLNDISTKLLNSSYTEFDQVVQDFRRIFNNVRLYLKSYPDSTMKKHVNKVSSEFEKILAHEFQNKCESRTKTHEHDSRDQSNKKFDKDNLVKTEGKKEEAKTDSKLNEDDKH
ncbi:uncharacterized protein Mtsh [Vanessa tameamea]|uniref:Uncharacterized protein Mtsh n=1 Tax=Vanessa tameamea TaxID=334116 RepID=A0A8B8HT10_VANTA